VGIDLTCVPVRLDSAAVRKLRQDADVWEEASPHPPFTGGPRPWPPPALNESLLADLPPEARLWSPFPDRGHAQAEYLLDPVGHGALAGWAARERSLPYRIIHGDRPFAPHAVGGQGIAWRCSTVAFLREAATVIDELDEVATREAFRVADMVAAAVYKARADEDDDDAFARLLAGLRRLSGAYRLVADLGLDLIIEQD
jgi:hypothetical protein